MDGDQKKSLKIAISEFSKLNFEKRKEYTIKHFKSGGIPISKIKVKQKEIDQHIVIKMFKNLKTMVHMANENGLTVLLKI